LLEKTFGEDNLWEDDMTFSPDAEGQPTDKDKVALTIETLASWTGEDLFDQEGRKRFTGHAQRVSGARFLGALGLEFAKISLIARWSSAVVPPGAVHR